jgi:ribosomal-protein-alanine N-acetyltransferase
VTLRVEPFRETDLDAVAAIEHAAFRGDRSLEQVRARLADELGGPLSHAWVAREGEPIVGYAVALHAADELHVLNVATVASARRRGVGAALVAAMLAYAVDARLRLLVLEVRRSNSDAIRLYRRAGFAAVHVRRRYYPDDEDAVEMHAELDAAGAVIAREDEVRVE